ncbi:MAG TPA: anthranilate phosphoribosyltransferase [Candidatus Omnitrophota bacterium]|nr:anthranilate phosphoribosyltransferase [Candidatus Omnitrophota bacterium]HPS37147.1 anthranilate phosphoribosyltransferase [Candidatus Omnitrophota bacterium]
MPKGPFFDALKFTKGLSKLLLGKDLTVSESKRIFEMLFAGFLPLSKAKAFLLLLSQKGETPAEFLGCLRALRRFEKTSGPRIAGLMDTCGTGGDGRRTLNISTLAALVLAGAGVRIAKHGNRAISSRSGSSDLMESFGVRLSATQAKMVQAIRSGGIGYFHAPFYHPVFAAMQPLRQSLKRRTILNLLGPLVNPLRLDHQLVGVSSRCLLPLYAKVLSQLGRKTALVCHAIDGMDEISTSKPTQVAWVTPGKVRYGMLRPETFGLQKAAAKDLTIDSVKKSREIAEKILTGRERGPARDLVVLNAAYGLVLCDKAAHVREGIRLAEQAIDSGRALASLNKLRRLSR